MQDRRAILCGYYGRGNAGDEALLATLLQMLPERVAPVVLSANPARTRALGVESIPGRSAFDLLAALRSSDALIWGGGSLMQDASSWRNPLYYGGLMALAQQRGLTAIAWAQGIGPLRLPLSRWVARQTLTGCTAISVRDRVSAQQIVDWGLPAPTVAPDPVWALDSKPLKGLWELPAPRIAVVLRAHPSLTPARLQTLSDALVSFQRATQTCVLAVPFQPRTDAAIARQIVAAVPNAHLVTSDDPRELKGLFRGVELAIAMRLHGAIMAAAEECRCYTLSYDPKLDRLQEALNLAGCRLESLPDAGELSAAWLELYANGSALDPVQIQSLSDRARIHREVLVRALE